MVVVSSRCNQPVSLCHAWLFIHSYHGPQSQPPYPHQAQQSVLLVSSSFQVEGKPPTIRSSECRVVMSQIQRNLTWTANIQICELIINERFIAILSTASWPHNNRLPLLSVSPSVSGHRNPAKVDENLIPPETLPDCSSSVVWVDCCCISGADDKTPTWEWKINDGIKPIVSSTSFTVVWLMQ